MAVRSANKVTMSSARFRRVSNNVQRLREDQLLTKAELARRAGISPLIVSRIESGLECRMDTQRKIILALGLTPAERRKVFGRTAGRATLVSAPRGATLSHRLDTRRGPQASRGVKERHGER